MELIIMLIIGTIIGWIAGIIFNGSKLGKKWNIVMGIISGLIGYWLYIEVSNHTIIGKFEAMITGVIGMIIIMILSNVLTMKQ